MARPRHPCQSPSFAPANPLGIATLFPSVNGCATGGRDVISYVKLHML